MYLKATLLPQNTRSSAADESRPGRYVKLDSNTDVYDIKAHSSTGTRVPSEKNMAGSCANIDFDSPSCPTSSRTNPPHNLLARTVIA